MHWSTETGKPHSEERIYSYPVMLSPSAATTVAACREEPRKKLGLTLQGLDALIIGPEP